MSPRTHFVLGLLLLAAPALFFVGWQSPFSSPPKPDTIVAIKYFGRAEWIDPWQKTEQVYGYIEILETPSWRTERYYLPCGLALPRGAQCGDYPIAKRWTVYAIPDDPESPIQIITEWRVLRSIELKP